jgi:hypothetical protein
MSGTAGATIETTGATIVPATDYTFGPKFDALRNAIYHVARRNYFDLLNRLLNFVVIILGAGVAAKSAKLFHVEELSLEFGVLIAATMQLTFDFGYRARTHEILQMKYYEMLADIELDPAPNPNRWFAKLHTIAAGEPMPMRELDALAYNAALDATTSDPEVRKENRLLFRLCIGVCGTFSHSTRTSTRWNPSTYLGGKETT